MTYLSMTIRSPSILRACAGVWKARDCRICSKPERGLAMYCMIKAYLHARRCALFVFALCAVLLLVTFSAFSQPQAPLRYGLFLCAFTLLLLAAADFFRFRRRLSALRAQDAQCDVLVLPRARDAIDGAYDALCRALHTRALSECARSQDAQSELCLLYTSRCV